MKNKIQNVLADIEKQASKENNPYWVISRPIGKFLNDLVRKQKMKTALEVGTSIGYSGIWLAEGLKETGGKLYTIESHKERFNKAKENFKKAELLNEIVQLKGHAPDVQIDDMFDLLFLDATKCEYVSYLVAFLFHMKKGGVIIADNALSHKNELRKYHDYIFNSPHLESKLIKEGSGIFISKIIK